MATQRASGEQIAKNDSAWMTLYQLKNLYVTEPWVHGFSIDAGGLTPNSVWADVYVTQH